MMKDYIERSVSRDVKETVHGIVQNHIWNCADVVVKKRGVPKDRISSIQLRVDKLNNGLLHIHFIEEEMVFSIHTLTGSSCDLVLWHMDKEQTLMTKDESYNILSMTQPFGKAE